MNKLLVLLLLLPLASVADIYRTTDRHGNVVYTDKPAPADSGTKTETVDLGSTNTAPPPPERPTPAIADYQLESADYSVAIVSPGNEATIPNGPGNFSVNANVKPPLEAGFSLQLFIDNIPHGDPQRSTSWLLTNIFRGAHDLEVTIIDGDQKPLLSSEPVRVYVHRPSVNFGNRN